MYKFFAIVILCFIWCQPGFTATTLYDDLVAYLDFEQAAPKDVSGNSITVINNQVVGNTLQGHYTPVTGVAGDAGFYNRSLQSYTKISTSFGSTSAPVGGAALGYNFSVSAWYYLQPLNADPTGDKRFFVYESDDQYELSMYIKGYMDGGSPAPFSVDGVTSTNGAITNIGVSTSYDTTTHLGSWNQIVDTFSLTDGVITKKTYINGVLKNTTTRTIEDFKSSIGINLATFRDNNGRFWDGFLDEVGVWSRTLTAAEIQELFLMNSAGISLVPEPSKAILVSFGFLGLILSRRRIVK